MTVTINGTNGVTTPEVVLDNSAADGAQVVLKSSGYSNWNLDNYSGRLRGYYGSTEYWTVDTSGNVGIGTSSPATKLDVVGIATVRNNSAAFNTTPNTSYGLNFQASSSGVTYITSYSAGGSTSIAFATNNGGGAAAERARIDESGNLMVGTTSVLGRQTNSYDGNTAFGLALANTAGGTAGQIAIRFMRNGSDVGSVTTTNTATAYNTSSDYRLKEDVQPMTGALAKVTALKPCTYKWKADGSDGEGFIAHELQAVVPQCVTGEKDAVDAEGNPVYQGIDTSFLVATLTAAIQELKAIVDAQGAEIAALKGTA